MFPLRLWTFLASSSGRFEKRFEAATEVALLQKPIPQDELIEEDGPQDEALSRLLPFGRHLRMPLEERFELLIPRLDRPGAEQMQDTADFPARIICQLP
jgi:hypothetical protein